MRAHLNFADAPDGLIDVQLVFPEGGFQKESPAHQHALMAMKYLEAVLKLVEPARESLREEVVPGVMLNVKETHEVREALEALPSPMVGPGIEADNQNT